MGGLGILALLMNLMGIGLTIDHALFLYGGGGGGGGGGVIPASGSTELAMAWQSFLVCFAIRGCLSGSRSPVVQYTGQT